MQTKVFNFAEYLLSKVEHEAEETANWSGLSLASAMRGMEDETSPAYSMAKLKAVFS